MEDTLKESAKQVPALAVLVVFAYFFLKHLAIRDTSLSKLLSEHATAQQHSNEVISANTRSMAENTRALDEMRRSLHSASTTIMEAVTNGHEKGKQ